MSATMEAVTKRIAYTLAEDEIELQAIRAQGAGGQNVLRPISDIRGIGSLPPKPTSLSLR